MIKIFSKKKNDDEREVTIFGITLKYKSNKYKKRKSLDFYKNQPLEEKIKKITKQFKKKVGYTPNILQPRSFNEKIQWLKLFYHNPLLTLCADKHLVKDYISQKIGAEYVIPTLYAYNNVDEIDFNALPDQFVLKLNCGCGKNIICRNKSQLDIENTKEKLKNWLNLANHYCYSYEWAYLNIKPVIICEKFISQIDGDLFDYKFSCYNGRVENLYIASERRNKAKFNYYNRDWSPSPFSQLGEHNPAIAEKPQNLDRMIELAEILAQPFPFVRVDFYDIDNHIYFGELTFYPANGMEPFTPQEWDYKMGEKITLPQPQE